MPIPTARRVLVEWSGVNVVGNAVSVLHFDEAQPPDPAAIKTAFQNVAGSLSSGTTLTIPNTGDVINTASGNLVGSWTGTGGGTIQGSATGAETAAGVGGCITLRTDSIIRGRRARGRLFVVPMAISCYDAAGTLKDADIGRLQALGDSLIAAHLLVWSRPTTKGGVDGNGCPVTTASVRDKVAFLSSRRD